MGCTDTEYRIVSNLFEIPSGNKVVSYGIWGKDKMEANEIMMRDISIKYYFVYQIWRKLLRENVSLEHMKDVIEDTIFEEEQVYS